jgi:hypothetical protein
VINILTADTLNDVENPTEDVKFRTITVCDVSADQPQVQDGADDVTIAASWLPASVEWCLRHPARGLCFSVVCFCVTKRFLPDAWGEVWWHARVLGYFYDNSHTFDARPGKT